MIFVMYECEERLGYSFKDKTLLRTCFTHSSYSHEHGGKNNERLEFFGDSILGFVVTEYLFDKFPGEGEGQLTLYKQQIVSRKPLAEAIVRLGLNDYILYGEGERKNAPEHHEAACENLYEALVAGIYIDGGGEEARKFIRRTLIAYFKPGKKNVEETPAAEKKIMNFKGVLQEYVQKQKLGDIIYKETGKSGPQHDPLFSVSVYVNGKKLGSGQGKKKAEAEQAAASAAYLKLSDKSAAKNSDKTDAGMKKTDGTDKVNNKSEAKTVQADYKAARSVKPRKPQVKKAGKTGENEAMKKSGKSPQTQNRFKFGVNKPTENKKTGKWIYSQTEERRKIK